MLSNRHTILAETDGSARKKGFRTTRERVLWIASRHTTHDPQTNVPRFGPAKGRSQDWADQVVAGKSRVHTTRWRVVLKECCANCAWCKGLGDKVTGLTASVPVDTGE